MTNPYRRMQSPVPPEPERAGRRRRRTVLEAVSQCHGHTFSPLLRWLLRRRARRGRG